MVVPENNLEAVVDALSALDDSQFAIALSLSKSRKDTKAFHDRVQADGLPTVLKERIKPATVESITPKIGTYYETASGTHYSSVRLKVNRYWFDVHPVDSESGAGIPLEIVGRSWNASTRYITGISSSDTVSLAVRYGDLEKFALASSYGDPGCDESENSHGGVSEVLSKVLRDIGLEERTFAPLALLELLMGDGYQLLKRETSYIRDRDVSLHDILKDKVDDFGEDDEYN